MPEADQAHPDGLALWKAWRDHAAANPDPKPEDWATLVAKLRLSVELTRREISIPELPEGMTGPEYALRAVLEFLANQPVVTQHHAHRELLKLHSAIVDLADGRKSPLFNPRNKTAGSPGKGRADAFFQGAVARAMSLYMEGGMSKEEAATRVGEQIGTNPTTVRSWRDQLKSGKGPGSPPVALEIFGEELPDDLGATPTERAENLLDRLLKLGLE